jgi:anthranilate synthase component 1
MNRNNERMGGCMSGKRGDDIHLVLPGERFTPFTLAKKLSAKAILESASFNKGRERYSLILVDEAFRVRQDEDRVVLIINGIERPWSGREDVETNPGMHTERGQTKSGLANRSVQDIVDVLASIASENQGAAGGLPIPAAGIGYFGYDFARRCDKVEIARKPDEIGVPEAEFLVGHMYVVFDHYTDMLHIVGLNYSEHEIDLQKKLDQLKKRLSDLDFSHLAPAADIVPFRIISDEIAEKSNFCEGVKKIRERIVAGDLLQAVLSRRLIVESGLEPMEGYRRLRSASPSPYLFHIDFTDFALVGASPESLVRLRDGIAYIRPIAGTRRRGINLDEDVKLEKELLADPKEKAEHLMLVDLARNDLGRVCVPGSVSMVRSMTPERFSHVIHLVSEVQGTPDPTRSPYDLLRSAFPAGTVSGAPKLKAMEIVSGLERFDRSFYAGAVGYFDASGGFDTCITIRCALAKGGNWYLQAGAGIVYGSKPEREWEETGEKLAALKLALSGGAL